MVDGYEALNDVVKSTSEAKPHVFEKASAHPYALEFNIVVDGAVLPSTKQLGLDVFWRERLTKSRKGTRWDQILQTLVLYRLIDPGSEWRLQNIAP